MPIIFGHCLLCQEQGFLTEIRGYAAGSLTARLYSMLVGRYVMLCCCLVRYPEYPYRIGTHAAETAETPFVPSEFSASDHNPTLEEAPGAGPQSFREEGEMSGTILLSM